MNQKELRMSEAEVVKILQPLLSKIGFNFLSSDTNRQLTSNTNKKVIISPDFIAQKRIDGNDYKIAIEFKQNSNLNDAVKYGIKTLNMVGNIQSYDKLLLLLINRNNSNYKSSLLERYQLEKPTNLEIINLNELEKWSENLANKITTFWKSFSNIASNQFSKYENSRIARKHFD